MSGVISSRVSNLKFMQRAIQKNEHKAQAEAIDKRVPEAHNEEHWIAPRRGGEKGCVVLLEGDPPATSGRMSFQGFTTETKSASRIEAREQGKPAEVQEGVSVGDDVMAVVLGKTKKQKKKENNSKEPEHFHRGVKKFKKSILRLQFAFIVKLIQIPSQTDTHAILISNFLVLKTRAMPNQENIASEEAAVKPSDPPTDATPPAITDAQPAEPGAQAPALAELPADTNPNKKRKCVLFLSYVGHGYQGMQRNPGAKTIEDDLFNAITKAGGISEANSDEEGFRKIHFMRAARTDKGVSAVGQVVSLMMVVNPPGVIDRINAALPPAIRVYGYRRAVKGFDARKACDKRRYEYILPVWMFDPKMEGIYRPRIKKIDTSEEGAKKEFDEEENEEEECDLEEEAVVLEGEAAVTAEAITLPLPGHPYGSDSTFVFDTDCIHRLNGILSQYQGTKNFHNYTVRVAASAPQAKRYIHSFVCDGVFEINGTQWVRTVVIGQSFMLHQIRKMIGMALAEFRGIAPEGCLKYALGTFHPAKTPMAPDLGLFLDECYYEAYNKRWGHQNEHLHLSDWQGAVDEFKKKKLYPALAKRDVEENTNAIWLYGLKDTTYKFSEWLDRGDSVKGSGGSGGGGGGRAKQQQQKRQAPGGGTHGGDSTTQEADKKAKVDRSTGNMSLQAEYSE